MKACDYAQTRVKDFTDLSVGWMYPRNSMIQPLFDRFWMQLDERGVIDQLKTKYWGEKPECAPEGIVEVDLNFVIITFIILCFGTGLALLWFLFESLGNSLLQGIGNWP